LGSSDGADHTPLNLQPKSDVFCHVSAIYDMRKKDPAKNTVFADIIPEFTSLE
jgi:hypothetical protein